MTDEGSETPSEALHERIADHLERTKAVILQGPPGTGKTFAIKHVIRRLVDGEEDFNGEEQDVEDFLWSRLAEGEETHLDLENQEPDVGENDEADYDEWSDLPVVWDLVQMHPGYSYEDFVRGIGTSDGELSFESKDRVVPQLAEVAKALEDKPVVLVLDEINRCNLAGVLGELILTLEEDKRSESGDGDSGWPVQLEYPPPEGAEPGFEMPENLYVLGTMNTADRSIAMVDYAIRRRFRFVDVEPDPDIVRWYYEEHCEEKYDNVPDGLGRLATGLMVAVNAALEDRPRLKPGHSYFLVSPDDGDDWIERFADRVAYDLFPLLKEYERSGEMNGDDSIELSFDIEGSDEDGEEYELSSGGYSRGVGAADWEAEEDVALEDEDGTLEFPLDDDASEGQSEFKDKLEEAMREELG
jgi:DNA polymerase III delta prime subunit